MAYRIAPDEPLEDALHRIGKEQLTRALKSLALKDTIKASHETRKAIKRLRALLRLVRSGIGEATFKRENSTLGDISRLLSGARDRDVIAATLAELAAHHPEFKAEADNLLISPQAATAPEPMPLDQARKQARTGLEDCRKRWRALQLDAAAADAVLEAGLARSLRDLADALEEARDGEAEAVHEWRKSAQRHWRHMRLLEGAWPDYFNARHSEARAISELLGRSQDLTLVDACIRDAQRRIPPKKMNALLAIIEAEQTVLREEARLRTGRLTAEGPRGHARRAVTYFKNAQPIENVARLTATETARASARASKKRAPPRPDRGSKIPATVAAHARSPRKSAGGRSRSTPKPAGRR